MSAAVGSTRIPAPWDIALAIATAASPADSLEAHHDNGWPSLVMEQLCAAAPFPFLICLSPGRPFFVSSTFSSSLALSMSFFLVGGREGCSLFRHSASVSCSLCWEKLMDANSPARRSCLVLGQQGMLERFALSRPASRPFGVPGQPRPGRSWRLQVRLPVRPGQRFPQRLSYRGWPARTTLRFNRIDNVREMQGLLQAGHT